MSRSVLARFSALIGVLSAASLVQAADLTWGGLYRVEGVHVKNPELGGPESTKSYGLHHLILTPKIQAADGLTIHSRFDILNSDRLISPTGQVTSVAGDFLGNGPGQLPDQPGATATNNINDSNVLSRTQRATALQVTSLYATWTQEFGQLVVGRTPFQFGLGTTYSAGNGLFDHYINTRDLVGYKVILGNLSFFPMIGKVNEGTLGVSDDVDDYIVQVMYENPETELALGGLYERRYWTLGGNDYPGWNGTAATPPTTTTRTSGGDLNLISIFTSQKVKDFTIALEVDLVSGDTGIQAAGSNVSVDAMGIALDVSWKPQDSRVSAFFKGGYATGDDPGTADKYEGFIFNRNYDVGMLMFNHPLGQYDVLRTSQGRGPIQNGPVVPPSTVVPNRDQIDTEAISNAIYLAPGMQYQWKDNLAFGGTLVYGRLVQDPIANGSTSKDLGFELDLNVTFKPYERLTWITEAAALFPGKAWEGSAPGQTFNSQFAYGFTTKAAISF